MDYTGLILPMLRPVIGTLAHNRQFTAVEITEYTRYDRRINGPAAIRVLRKLGYIAASARGKYYPTSEGWKWIEGSES